MPELVQELTIDELRALIEETVRRALEDFFEDLEALSSPAFLASISEAREDFQSGNIQFLSPSPGGRGVRLGEGVRG